jgi:hypothetical protein
MSTHKLPSNWLNDPSDDAFIEKSVGHGLGSLIAGAPLVQRLAKAAETVLVCKSGHETTLGKAEGERCARKDCRAPLMVKGAQPDEVEPEVRTRRMVKSDDMVETGGTIDSQPILTKRAGNPRRGLWTGSR